MSRPSFHRNRFRGAFTLVELLVVMAIIGILLYLAVPASTSLQQSSNLAMAGQSVADQISVAREMAASRNQVVELRFISPTSWSTSGGYTGFHALQLWTPNDSGTSVPASRLLGLPDSIEISNNPSLSPLLNPLAGSENTMPTGAVAGKYVSFYIRPAGTVQVAKPPTDASGAAEDNANQRAPSYFLTILPVRYDTSTTLPHNYVTVQINPDTGRTQSYRP